jgi:hypothetical protein
MFCFVAISTSAPSRPDFLESDPQLSRPMRAFDAFILASFLTLAMGAPALVFAVIEDSDHIGEMPDSFRQGFFADYRDSKTKPSGRNIIHMLNVLVDGSML